MCVCYIVFVCMRYIEVQPHLHTTVQTDVFLAEFILQH